MFKSLLKATIGVVKLPIDVAADVVTMGGVLSGKNNLPGDDSYTESGVKKIMENLDKATR